MIGVFELFVGISKGEIFISFSKKDLKKWLASVLYLWWEADPSVHLPLRREIIVRGQSYFSRLPKY
jgi:hypothetical protein